MVDMGCGDVCNVVQVQCTWTDRRASWFGRRKWRYIVRLSECHHDHSLGALFELPGPY